MINLLPEPEKLKIKHKQQNFAIVIISLSVFLISFIAWFILKNINEVYEMRDINNTKEIEQLNVKIENQQKIKNDLSKIFNKSDSLTELKSSRILWSQVISEFSKTVPQNVQINSLSITGTPLVFTITATTKTRPDVENFKKRIDDSPYFEKASYSSTTETQTETLTTVSFNMTFLWEDQTKKEANENKK
ncbi:MAG: PilN domain-containing protein [Patescibacteria group bacterium]|jgi:Tfp pilus assembly protein PilN